MRSKIDRLKGGGLVERVGVGKVIGLILSDVIGDPIAAIAAGLTHHPDADNILIGNNRQACEAVAETALEHPQYLESRKSREEIEAKFRMK